MHTRRNELRTVESSDADRYQPETDPGRWWTVITSEDMRPAFGTEVAREMLAGPEAVNRTTDDTKILFRDVEPCQGRGSGEAPTD